MCRGQDYRYCQIVKVGEGKDAKTTRNDMGHPRKCKQEVLTPVHFGGVWGQFQYFGNGAEKREALDPKPYTLDLGVRVQGQLGL